MRGEPCNYEAVRDFIYGLFEENPLLEGYRYWFYIDYERQLAEKKFDLPNMRTTNQILDIWIHTQGAHSGKIRKGKGFQGNFSLTDFDEVVRKIGRAKFKFEFRIALKCVGDTYVRFSRTLAIPLFERLQRDGLQPSFDVVAALRNSAYPQRSDRIQMSDYFWHLDKETPEQTFDRLIERSEFSDLRTFFCGYFFARRPAFDALNRFSSLESLVQGTDGVIATQPYPAWRPMCQFPAKGDCNSNGGTVKVFEGKKVIFAERSRYFLGLQYLKFRSTFLAHRESIPKKWDNWKGNWHGI